MTGRLGWLMLLSLESTSSTIVTNLVSEHSELEG